MRLLRAFAFTLACAFALPANGGNEIYKYTDANGALRFTTNLDEVPPAQRAAARARVEKSAPAPAPPASAADSARTAARPSGKVRASSHTPDTLLLLRDRLLRGKATTYGIDAKLPAWGVVMEEGVDGGFFTLVALADGSASIYFSNGGGVIGGEAVPAINAAARRMVERAAQDLPACAISDAKCWHERPSLQRAANFPRISRGDVQFYVLTPTGVLTASAMKMHLASRSNPGWPLYFAGHDVITGLREASEAQGIE
jgi:hypothetical protein